MTETVIIQGILIGISLIVTVVAVVYAYHVYKAMKAAFDEVVAETDEGLTPDSESITPEAEGET